MWAGLKTISDYKGKTSSADVVSATLPEDLNTFYACVESSSPAVEIQEAQDDCCPPVISREDVWRSLNQINTRKAPGPDGIPGRALKVCADQLADVFTDIFNLSLLQPVVPACFKEIIIVPVPKRMKTLCLNDYCPLALTSTIMKCFERRVKTFITSSLPDSLDPLQFAYRSNRWTADAISLTVHTALSHLDQRNTYVRMLFIDYSSAFNFSYHKAKKTKTKIYIYIYIYISDWTSRHFHCARSLSDKGQRKTWFTVKIKDIISASKKKIP